MSVITYTAGIMKVGKFNYGGNCVFRFITLFKARIFDLVFASHHQWQRMNESESEREQREKKRLKVI